MATIATITRKDKKRHSYQFRREYKAFSQMMAKNGFKRIPRWRQLVNAQWQEQNLFPRWSNCHKHQLSVLSFYQDGVSQNGKIRYSKEAFAKALKKKKGASQDDYFVYPNGKNPRGRFNPYEHLVGGKEYLDTMRVGYSSHKPTKVHKLAK